MSHLVNARGEMLDRRPDGGCRRGGRRSRRAWCPTGLLTLLLLVPGCMPPLPVPTVRHTPKDAGTRSAVGYRSLGGLKPGSSTRADVLWQLGEPDIVSTDERLLVYRWLTIGGLFFFGVDVTEMAPRRRDLMFEFDPSGVLARYGDVETLVTEPIHDAAPFDATPPVVLSVLHRSSTWRRWAPAVLRLERHRVSLAAGRASIEIRPSDVRYLQHGSDDRELWPAGWLTYRLGHANDEGTVDEMRLQVTVLDVPRLAKYLQQRSPTSRIRD